MSMFVCSKCGCADNTAVGDYWLNMDAPLCTECSTGKWHGFFPKEVPSKSVLARWAARGNLEATRPKAEQEKGGGR